MYAVTDKNLDILKELLDFGAKDLFATSPTAANRLGHQTEYLFSIFARSIARVRLEAAEIILRRASISKEQVSQFVNEKSEKNGRRALHLAAQKNSANLVRLLLENGADWKARDDNGARPIDMAGTEVKSLFGSFGCSASN